MSRFIFPVVLVVMVAWSSTRPPDVVPVPVPRVMGADWIPNGNVLVVQEGLVWVRRADGSWRLIMLSHRQLFRLRRMIDERH